MEDFSGVLLFMLWIAIAIFYVAVGWRIFTKAGKPGWAAIIPIYNLIVLLEIVGRPLWWFLLFLIPLVNVVVAAIVSIDLARSFGRSTGFGIGLWLLGFIFGPIVAFGNSRYAGQAAARTAPIT